MSETEKLVRLLQLASPALPVGAYSYSQGLEAAAHAGIVRDAPSASRWIGDALALCMAGMEAPILLRLVAAWEARALAAAQRWNGEFVASRETMELRAETLQMGYSLRQLLEGLALDTQLLALIEEPAFPTAFAFAVAAWRIEPPAALAAYLFAWLENQVLAALKCASFGQTEAQRILSELAQRLPAVVARAQTLADDELVNLAPGLAILSARHETQYSRIFRS